MATRRENDAIHAFDADIIGLADLMGIEADHAVQKVALDIHTGITVRNPVLTGRSQANWQIGFGSPSRKQVGPMAAPSLAPIFEQQSLIPQATVNKPTYITNNLIYVPRLEDGYSDQAPNGMVSITLVEVSAGVNFEIGSFS